MGFKRSSEIITISGKFANATAGFSTSQIDLQLNPLDQEVFVVLSCTIDFLGSGALPVAPVTSLVFASENECALSSVRPASQLDISNSNVFAYAREATRIGYDSSGDPTGISVVEQTSDVPDTNLDYIAIIATSNFFVGTTDDPNNANDNDVAFRVWGYRAKADAATYAALVQSEVLSA